jgi:cathepsin A (carboxypeptidase C)
MNLAIVVFSVAAATVFGAYEPDRILNLPGVANFESLPFKQYSGYLNGSVDGRIQLHYWFAQSQSATAATDPVVVWLNGGPGCSSLDGYLYEHGPLLVNEDGQTLRRNQWAWNTVANMLYIESPACVGFSYAKDGNCTVDDDLTAEENYQALLSFFDKFSEYKNNELYITGESYGGIYVPTLTLKIFQSDSGLNLKGFAVGNGLLSESSDTNSLVNFGYGHGIIGQAQYQKVLDTCCAVESVFCDFLEAAERLPDCGDALWAARSNIYFAPDVNTYDVTGSCYQGVNVSTDAFAMPCIDKTDATIWLNYPYVREALHIAESVGRWEICSLEVFIKYKRIYNTMYYQFQTLLSGGIRALVYSGDLDAACNVLGNSYFVNQLGYNPTSEYKPWKIGSQIDGWGQSYGDTLQFLTVKGAGHQVPQYKPRAALQMFMEFLNNKYQ